MKTITSQKLPFTMAALCFAIAAMVLLTSGTAFASNAGPGGGSTPNSSGGAALSGSISANFGGPSAPLKTGRSFQLDGKRVYPKDHKNTPAKSKQVLGPVQYQRSTYYSVPPCDAQGTITASGQTVHFGVIASNWLPLYTVIRFVHPLFGRRYFQVLDTGAPFDIWLPCGPMTDGWSNPTLAFQIVKK